MDIISDSSRATLFRIVGDGCPDYVKEARPASSKEAAASLPDSMFADRANRAYPIESKAATWLSAAYFAKTAGDDGYDDEYRGMVGDAIRRAASIYGNRDDVDAVMSRYLDPPAEKQASAESCYGLPESGGYPMFDEYGVSLANDHFSRNAYAMPPPDRHRAARAILAKCAEYGVEPSDTVRVEAGDGWNKRDFVCANIAMRASACPDRRASMTMAKMAEAVLCAPSRTYVSLLAKVAETLEGVDAAFGFDSGYATGQYIPPAQVCFGLTVKSAEDGYDSTVVLNGRAFDVNALSRLPLSVFTGALGDGFGRRVLADAKEAEDGDGAIDPDKLGDELRSMPNPDKRALFDAIAEYAD